MRKIFLCLICVSVIQAKTLSFLGDIYTDSGNFPTTPIDGGNTIWPNMLAARFGQTVLPSTQGGTNFAYAFAETGSNPFPTPSLIQQSASLLSASLKKEDPIFIFGGANDILFQSLAPFSAVQSAQNIAQIVSQLRSNGYKTLFVLNLFDIGKVPTPPVAASTLSSQTLQFNTQLVTDLGALSDSPVIVDVYSLVNAIFADPLSYGFTNVTNTSPIANFQGYLWWYPIEPMIDPFTIYFYPLLSDYIFSLIQGANNYSLLAEQPHMLLRAQNSLLSQQLFPAQDECHQLDVLYLFAGGNYIPQGLAPRAAPLHAMGRGGSILVGATDRPSEWLTLGLAASYQMDTFNGFNQGSSCQFDLQSETASLFAGTFLPHSYINGYFNFAWLQFHNFKRHFSIGPVTSETHGHTNGTALDVTLDGGYYPLDTDKIKTGPLTRLEYHNVRVKGFQESSASIGNLLFHSQHLHSLAFGLGWDMRFWAPFRHWALITDISLSGNKQWLAGPRTIHFRQVSIPGPFGSWPLSNENVWYGSGKLTFNAALDQGTNITLGYTLNYGGKKMRENVISLTFNLPTVASKKNF